MARLSYRQAVSLRVFLLARGPLMRARTTTAIFGGPLPLRPVPSDLAEGRVDVDERDIQRVGRWPLGAARPRVWVRP